MQLLKHFASLTLHPKNAQELKDLILQLAVQGKLTANWRKENPDIENASILLERIQVKKAKLIREKKIPKEKPFPKIDTITVRYTLPKKWIWCNLGESIVLFSGRDLTPNEYSDSELKYPYLTGASQIKKDNIILSRWTNIPKVISILGDVLVSVKGTIGKTVINKIGEIHIARQIMALRTYDWIEIKFLKLFADSYLSQLQDASNGIIPGISREHLLYAEFPLPPIEEQKEIVRVVEILFKEIEQLDQLTVERIALKNDYVSSALQQLTTQNSQKEWQSLQPHFKDFFTEKSTIKKLRETVLQLAVQGKLTADWRTKNKDFDPASELLKRIQKEKAQLIKDKKVKKESPLPAITKEEIPYELPEGWVWCRFGDLITFLNGYAFKSSTYVPTSDYQIIRLGNVKDDNFLINTKEAYVPSSVGEVNLDYQIFKDDILTTLTGTKNRRDYCFTCLVKPEHLEQKVLLLNQRVGCIRVIDKSASELINKFLKSDIILNQLFETETGTANQGNIGSTAFKNLVFPLPPLEEQKAIVEKVNALVGLCDALEQEVAQSKGYSEQLMQSVLREVFNKK
ncbi:MULTISPECIES: restriction endonuclease subunit S [Flavobacterium]|uniref:Restriction endonuclease subunit S n=1 Tax=Flavobacterium jumunjinense TaxID=998845 RepID=A0ABV5GRX6_9FLAO|nr:MULTISPECIES: restriction endonuclease subunit S [Flavobacterium]